MTYLVCTPEEFMSSSFNDRLRYVQKQIHETPKQWDQDLWAGYDDVCGTTHCVAGWTVLLAGGRINYLKGSAVDSCGQPVLFSDFGMDTLGLTEDEAWNMFYSLDTSITDLDEMIDELTARDR